MAGSFTYTSDKEPKGVSSEAQEHFGQRNG